MYDGIFVANIDGNVLLAEALGDVTYGGICFGGVTLDGEDDSCNHKNNQN